MMLPHKRSKGPGSRPPAYPGLSRTQSDPFDVAVCGQGHYTDAPALMAQLRVRLTYLWRHGRLPDLRCPTLFTELVQLRKLHERDRRLPLMADKVAVKSIVASQLGNEWVIPTLWTGTELPHSSSWSGPIIIKARHGCKQNIVVRGNEPDWRMARRRTRKWVACKYGGWLDEWLYAHIPRGLLIEPFIGRWPELPLDYKIFVFGGQATHVQVHLDRGVNHRWVVYDTQWRPRSDDTSLVPRPTALPAMIEAAELLAREYSFARVDFYQPGSQPLFGEMTFYPGSGLDKCEPRFLDEEMGRLWLNAGASHGAGRHRPDAA